MGGCGGEEGWVVVGGLKWKKIFSRVWRMGASCGSVRRKEEKKRKVTT